MLTSNDIVIAAKECLETPFGHQGRVPGRRMDCVGLVRYPAVRLGLVPSGTDFRAYHRQPNPKQMRELLLTYFNKSPNLVPGAIIWFEVGAKDPQHLAIYTFDNTIIHAMSDGPGKVVEHGYRSPWPGRAVEFFRYRGVKYG